MAPHPDLGAKQESPEGPGGSQVSESAHAALWSHTDGFCGKEWRKHQITVGFEVSQL